MSNPANPSNYVINCRGELQCKDCGRESWKNRTVKHSPRCDLAPGRTIQVAHEEQADELPRARPEKLASGEWGARVSQVVTRPLPDLIDPFDDLSTFTTDQLRTLNQSLETELLRIVNDHARVDAMRESDKVRVIDAINFLSRTGAEIVRRDSLPTPGPRAVHYEVMPDGSAPVRFSSTILAF